MRTHFLWWLENDIKFMMWCACTRILSSPSEREQKLGHRGRLFTRILGRNLLPQVPDVGARVSQPQHFPEFLWQAWSYTTPRSCSFYKTACARIHHFPFALSAGSNVFWNNFIKDSGQLQFFLWILNCVRSNSIITMKYSLNAIYIFC